MRIKLFLVLFIVLIKLDLFGQVIQNEIIVPPNLTANKFENSDIDKPNLYNGTVDDNITLYEIKVKQFSLPITLSHNYNGLKPAENASWVGLGWNLRVGGSISSKINGKYDDDSNGFYNISHNLNIPDPIKDASNFNLFISNLDNNKLTMFADGKWDAAPDAMMLSTNNISSDFIRLKDGSYATIPFRPIQITNPASDQYRVTDESGNTYYFGKLTQDDTNGIEKSSTNIAVGMDGDSNDSHQEVNSYVLRKIQLVTGENIVFNYVYENVWYEPADTETKYIFNMLGGTYTVGSGTLKSQMLQYVNTQTYHSFCRLSSIETPFEKIYFHSETLRNDLNSSDSYRLNGIEIEDVNNKTVKGWSFYYSYMGNTNNYSTCRLMLDSIADFGVIPSNHKSSYGFTYIRSTDIPPYDTKSIDHWGYYNGVSNETLIPKSIVNSRYNDLFLEYGVGGDREPNKIYSRIGLLTNIRLPTKGNVIYEYEPNTYNLKELVYDNVQVIAAAGVKKKVNIAVDTLVLTERRTVTIGYTLVYYQKSADGTVPALGTDEAPYVRISTNLESAANDLFYMTTSNYGASGTSTLTLSPGTYYLEASASASTNGIQQAGINISYQTQKLDANNNPVYSYQNKETAGSRIHQITRNAGNNNVVQTIDYSLSTDPSQTSGRLAFLPDYEYEYHQMNPQLLVTGTTILLPDLLYIVRTSNSLRPITSNGTHIYYPEVSVYNSNNIKSTSYFSSAQDIVFPRNASNISKSYKRGLLTKEVQFKNLTEGSHSIDYNYNFSRPENKNGIGGIFLVDYKHKDLILESNTFNPLWYGTILSEWIPLESTTEQVDGITTTKSYYYDNPVHAQVTRTKVDNTGEKYTYTLYSYDYSNTGAGDFIGEMKTGHILNKPIEKVTYVKDKTTGNLYVVGGEIYTYKTGIHAGQIESIYKLYTQVPIAISSFKFSNRNNIGEMPHVNTSFAGFSLTNMDARYSTVPEQKVISYDSNNNPQEIWSKNNTSTTYLWSYGHQYPIAEIKNATYADVKTALGYDDTQIVSLANNIAPDVTTIRNSLTTYFNNKEALITTYTYKLLVGILTSTDPRGVTTTYSYDDSNRLNDVKDINQNIIQQHRYHLQGQ